MICSIARRLGGRGLAAAALLCSGATTAAFSAGALETVSLATSVVRPASTTVVLIHGLDSAKDTWSGVLTHLAASGTPALAVDLRGEL